MPSRSTSSTTTRRCRTTSSWRRAAARSSCSSATSRTGGARSSTPAGRRPSASGCGSCAGISRGRSTSWPTTATSSRTRRSTRASRASSARARSQACSPSSFTAHVLKTEPEGTVTGVGAMDDGSLWINGGYLIFRHDIFDYLEEGEELVEEPFRRLIAARRLITDRHEGFWAPMDTLKEKNRLDALADTPVPPWAVWLQDSKVALETAVKRSVARV